MSDLPPRARLAHLLRSLATKLPAEIGPLLDAPRFAQGKTTLQKFADPTAAGAAAASMTPEEAGWMADLLLHRWSFLGDVTVDPAAAILAPEDLWIGDRELRLPLEIATLGIEDDWHAVWEGAVVEPGGPTGVLLARPPEGDAPAAARVLVRLRARAKGGSRCVLVAEATVRLRRPRIVASDDGRRLLVHDHTGLPGVGVAVEIGEQRSFTAAGGLIELPSEPAKDTVVRVEGVIAGRWKAG